MYSLDVLSKFEFSVLVDVEVDFKIVDRSENSSIGDEDFDDCMINVVREEDYVLSYDQRCQGRRLCVELYNCP